MKKFIFCLVLSMMTITAMADDVMTKSKDTIIVNTTSLCDTKGYKSTTPLKVYFLKGRIVKIVPLKNVETKKFFMRVEQGLFPKFIGMKAGKVKELLAPSASDGMTGATQGTSTGSTKPHSKLDGVTGATYSSNAVKSNVYSAVVYYLKR